MRVALAVAAGYFLGRTRKMKAALMLAGAGATGRLPSSSQGLVREGVKRLGNSAEVSKLAESLRGELVDAAKHAAVAAASNRIDALTSRIEETTEGVTKTTEGITKGVTDVLAPEEHEDTEASEPDDDSARDKGTASEERPKKSTAADRDEDRAGEHHDSDEDTEAPRRRSTSTRTRSTSPRSSTPRTRKAAQPKTRTSSRSASSDDAPVRRTGR